MFLSNFLYLYVAITILVSHRTSTKLARLSCNTELDVEKEGEEE